MELSKDKTLVNTILYVKPIDGPNINTVVACVESDDKVRTGPSQLSNDIHKHSSGPQIGPQLNTSYSEKQEKLDEEIEEEFNKKQETDLRRFLELLKKKRLQEKLVYVISLATIILLTHSLMASQWLLPYYYTVSTPCLLLIRTILYWKYRWHYFLLDFCYYGNILWFCFIWIAPHQSELFAVSFAVANGPLLWALVMFRNSLVLHSLDKVTSIYIHVLPSFLSFVIRWYPEESSKHWTCHFIPVLGSWSVIWLVAVPLAGFIVHSIFNVILISLCHPKEEYLTSYRYLTAKSSSLVFRAVNIFGPRWRYMMFILYNWLFCFVSVTMTILWYNYFIAHCVYLVVLLLIVTYNGASFYMDVFSVQTKK